MKPHHWQAIVISLALGFVTSADAAELPETSIYQLAVNMTDQSGGVQSLSTFRGHPVVISMFYATCPNVCPVLISTIQSLERALPADKLSDLRVLLISVDPDTDTPEVLAEVAARHRINTQRWKLTRATAQDVRKIAAVLSVKYRKLPSGEFNHTSILTLLDREGVVRAESAKIPGIDDAFLRAIKEI